MFLYAILSTLLVSPTDTERHIYTYRSLQHPAVTYNYIENSKSTSDIWGELNMPPDFSRTIKNCAKNKKEFCIKTEYEQIFYPCSKLHNSYDNWTRDGWFYKSYPYPEREEYIIEGKKIISEEEGKLLSHHLNIILSKTNGITHVVFFMEENYRIINTSVFYNPADGIGKISEVCEN